MTAEAEASADRYARTALEQECSILAGTTGGRNDQLNRSAYALGQFVGAGLLDEHDVVDVLTGATKANGYFEQDGAAAVRATIRSGLERGKLKPRDVPRGRDAGAVQHAAQPRPTVTPPAAGPARDDEAEAARIARAVAIWKDARHPGGTIVETYLASRGLELPNQVAGEAIRFHPTCPWWDEASARSLRVPAMVAAMRSIETERITAVHRTRLTADGRKVDRLMLGRARGAAIMLCPMSAVGAGLVVGEGIETCLAAWQLGWANVWALGSAGAIGSFPLLAGLQSLVLLAELDDRGANARAIELVGERYHQDGREVIVVEPRVGGDMNDALRAVA